MKKVAYKSTKERDGDVKEVVTILKSIENEECELPPKEKNILKWDVKELNAYIIKETKGMNPVKKLKFANQLIKRIKKEKRRVGK